MFKIYFVNSAYEKDQVLMYDDTRDDDELKLGNPKVHIEVNTAGTLDFELPTTNVAYSRIIPMVTELHVIKDNQKTHDKHIWFGRVLTIDTDLYGTKTIHCEGGLAYLNDCIYYDKTADMGSWNMLKTVGRAIFARFESPILNESGVHVYGVSPQEASAVIANIMSGGSEYEENLNAPFKHLGRIAKDTDSDFPVYAWVNEPVVPSGDQEDEDYYFDEDNLNSTAQKQCGISNPNNMTAIDLISSMMSNVGGLFWVSKTPHYPKRTFGGADLGDAVYVMQLHMRRHYPAFNPDEGQTIQFGENLADFTITDDGTTFFTAVHPHGQRVDSGEDFTLGGRGIQKGTTAINKRTWQIDPAHGVMYCPELVKEYGMIIRDLDVGTTNIYEQLIGTGISEIDSIPLISKTVGGDWASGVREMTVNGIDLSLYNVDYSSIELTDAVRVLVPRHGIDTYLNVTAIDYDLQNVENTVFTLNAIKSSNEITNASPSYGSSSVSPSVGSSYVHPKHTEHDIGFYKFSNDSLGHVDAAVTVNKKDITALGIPSEDTKYEITSYPLAFNGNFSDGPVVALKGTDGHHSHTTSSNTYTIATVDAFNSYNSGEEIINNGDKHRIILDLDIFASSRFYEESAKWTSYPIIIDSYITMTIQNIGKRFWVRIYTFARCNSDDMPTRAIVRQLDPNGQYSNIDWQVYSGSATNTIEGGIVTRFRIGIDSDTYGKIRSITRPKVYTTNVTSAYGDTLGTLRDSIDINAIGVAAVDTMLVLTSENASDVAFTGDYNDLSNKPVIPDISGKQDKTTAVTHSANTAVGSATKPVYVAANGAATPITHSINSDVPANAKFTDTTYNDATQSEHGLMTAADKKKLDGIDLSKYLNSALWVSGANGTAKWVRLGTLVSSGNFSNGVIRVWTGDGANGRANQNSSFEVQIKDGWQSTLSAVKACGVTVYRINCSSVKVKVIPTAHDTYTVWVYMPWGYWNGNYAVYGKYKSWTSQHLIQSDEPEGTGADIAYYDQAFLTSKVAKAAEAATLTDSGWVNCPLAVTGNTTYPTSASTIRVRKYGKMVKLEGWVKYAKAFNNGHNVAIIPDGYRPANAMNIIGVTNSGAGTEIEFYVTIGAYGNISFSPADQKSSATFNPAIAYEFYATYFID
jgi:hypothetical protein|nr:MAG TPA: endopeptidase tail [Caudoviricetes sp.]